MLTVLSPPSFGQADILVSELLGSFGDNELSPECLDGAQSFLKDDGISIPYEYTSYLAPITTSRLWNEVSREEFWLYSLTARYNFNRFN